MDEQHAREILSEAIGEDGRLHWVGLNVIIEMGSEMKLDGDFDVETLEALVWWMRKVQEMTA